jgi:signal transduction histidine kinase
MYYNSLVKRDTSFIDAVRLIRFAAILWIGYLTAQAIMNKYMWGPPGVLINNLFHFVLLGFVALICLGLAYWSWVQNKLRKAFIPLVIAIITIGPTAAAWMIIRLFPHNPPLSPDNSVLRQFPFLLVGFLLIAWQYKWQYMLLVILGVTGLNVAQIWSFPAPGPAPLQRAIIVTVTQAVIFLAVGFSISYLMSRLREQQQSLEAANIRLTHYASTLEQLATSRERNRLARELHDTLAHTLSGLSVQLETAKAYWDIDQKMAHSILDKTLAVAHSGLEETRRALKALRASPLDDLGLALAVKTMVEESTARAKMAVDLAIMDKMPALSPDVEQCIYRVAQEAVTNVVNHAHAKNLTVWLASTEGKVTLIVRDDGIGFDIEKINKSSQFGLTGMQERAHLSGGELTITSKPGQGTAIQLTV